MFLTASTGFAQLYQVRRLNDAKPVITQEMFTRLGCDERQGRNINGPSVVALPDWLKAEDRADPQARYYMYFAHHGGQYIRMAWASSPVGPWTLYQTGKDVPVGKRGVLDMGEDLRHRDFQKGRVLGRRASTARPVRVPGFRRQDLPLLHRQRRRRHRRKPN